MFGLAKPAAVAGWVEQTPADFVLTLKASRYLTHIKRLRDIEEGIANYYAAIEPLVGSNKLGPVLWHLPGNVKRDEERPWQPLELTADWSFVRFHYGHRGRRGNYSETELQEWAARLRDLRSQAEVFVYFNNDWEAFAPRNAKRLRSLIDG